MAPKLVPLVHHTVANNLPALPPRRARPGAPPVIQGGGGRRFELTRVARMGELLARRIRKPTLERLAMEQTHFMSALLETEKRLSGQRATVDQMVGTFLEVIGPDHPLVHEIRNDLVELNLEAALHANAKGESAFIPAGTDLTDKGLEKVAREVRFAWREGAGEVLPGILPDRESVPKNKRRKYDEEVDALMARRRANLDERRIRSVRDLSIDGAEFCDRAVLLELENGQWLLVLTEEYKTSGSGGVNPQTSIRDNRLFNKDVNSETKLKFLDENGDPQEVRFGNLLVNVNAMTSDKLGVKAAGRDRFEQRTLTVRKKVQERKAKYDDHLPLGADAGTSYFFVGLQYPGREIRCFFQELWGRLPR